jgi:hypothetical protein
MVTLVAVGISDFLGEERPGSCNEIKMVKPLDLGRRLRMGLGCKLTSVGVRLNYSIIQATKQYKEF